jgi:hypothetical protein
MRDLQDEITLTNLSGRPLFSSRARNSTVVLACKLLFPRNELLETLIDLTVCFLAGASYFVLFAFGLPFSITVITRENI